MRILIIGGTSFLGPHVVRLLCGMGHQVAVFHRGQSNMELPDSVEHIHGDRKNMKSFIANFRKFSPEVVLDMISYSEEDAKATVDAFQEIASRIVAVSSQDVYRAYGVARQVESGDLEPVPLAEQANLREKLYPYQDAAKGKNDWVNTYDKILVERIIMQNQAMPGTILRLPAIYGPMDSQHRFFSYLSLKRMADRRPYIIMDESFAQWRWTHAYVENAAYAIALSVVDSRSSGQIFNVGEPSAPTMYEWVNKIGVAMNWQGEILFVPKSELPEPYRFPLDTAQSWVADSQKIRNELHFHEIVPWEEGLIRTIKWEVEHWPENIIPKHQNIDYAGEDALLRKLGIVNPI